MRENFRSQNTHVWKESCSQTILIANFVCCLLYSGHRSDSSKSSPLALLLACKIIGEVPFHHEQTIGQFHENVFKQKTNNFATVRLNVAFCAFFCRPQPLCSVTSRKIYSVVQKYNKEMKTQNMNHLQRIRKSFVPHLYKFDKPNHMWWWLMCAMLGLQRQGFIFKWLNKSEVSQLISILRSRLKHKQEKSSWCLWKYSWFGFLRRRI